MSNTSWGEPTREMYGKNLHAITPFIFIFSAESLICKDFSASKRRQASRKVHITRGNWPVKSWRVLTSLHDTPAIRKRF